MISLEAYRLAIGSFHPKVNFRTTFVKRYRTYLDSIIAGSTLFSLSLLFLKLIVFMRPCLIILSILLLMSGDIESNPGPVEIMKVVQGTFNQSDPGRFGDSVGLQCSCNALFSLCWSKVKRVCLWKSWELDFILSQGNDLYRSLGHDRYLSFEDLPDFICYENNAMFIERIKTEEGLFQHNVASSILSTSYDRSDQRGNGLIFVISGFMFSLIWDNSSVYLFDSHSRDKNGQISAFGTSVLLKFKSLNDVETYIKETYVQQGSFCYFQFEYISVVVDQTTLTNIIHSISLKKKGERNTRYRSSVSGKSSQKLANQKYRASEQGKSKEKTYRTSDVGKSTERKYRASDKGKAKEKTYRASELGKIKEKAYRASELGKLKEKAYRASDLGKLKEKTYNASYLGKLRGKTYRASDLGKLKEKTYRASDLGKLKEKAYRASEPGKLKEKTYRISDLGKLKENVYRSSSLGKLKEKTYRTSDLGKLKERLYSTSELGKSREKKYRASMLGKLKEVKYRNSDLGNLAQKKYLSSPNGKVKQNLSKSKYSKSKKGRDARKDSNIRSRRNDCGLRVQKFKNDIKQGPYFICVIFV